MNTSEVNGILIIEPGEKVLDARTSKDFRKQMDEKLSGSRKVILNLAGLTFVDSSGLGTLLSCLRQVTAEGGDMKLCGLTAQVRAVFQLVRMHRLFDIYNTQEEAVESFQ